jgi:glycosyltransferase involved in cell wall biosynthesis
VTRIARIITRLNVGGPSIQAIDLSRELTTEGFDTCLIHGRLGDGEGDMTTFLSLGSTRTVFIDDLVRPISPLADIKALFAIYRTLKRWQPDIVHTHMAKAGTLGRLAGTAYNRTRGRRSRACLIHTYHGHVFEGYFHPLSTRIFLMIERWLARRTDILIAISAGIMGELLSTYRIGTGKNIRVIPLGFNLEELLAVTEASRGPARRALAIPEDAIVVTTVGRLTPIKQQALFLEMARRLSDVDERFQFLLVGDGESRLELEKHAEHLGISKRTAFVGWRGDLATIYAATDVFVLTSRNEGTPVALIEAMAAGVAAVSTDVGGVRDVISSPQLGVVVPPADLDALVTAVQELSNDPKRRQALGREARASVRVRFHKSRLVQDITNLYSQLVAEHRIRT